MSYKQVAVLVPCYNEGVAIAKVIKDFKAALPKASIYVYDNNSSDDTANNAKKAGAYVRYESRQGKGHVVRRMFADIEADIYVMVDGDATYDATAASTLVDTLKDGDYDMVVGARVEQDNKAYRSGHRLGNAIFNKILTVLFSSSYKDIFSGYRVFTRRFVKSFPIRSSGFDIETEISVHALQLQMPTYEIDTKYYEREEGSVSKLSTYRDGWKILWRIFLLLREVRPLFFFGSIAALMMLLSFALGYPVIEEYLNTGLVPRLPTAVLAVGVMLTGLLNLCCGLILDSVCQGRLEAKRLSYLQVPLKRDV